MRKSRIKSNNRRFESRKPLIRRRRFAESATGGKYSTIDESDLDIKHFSTTPKLVDRIDFTPIWDMYDDDDYADTINDDYDETIDEIDRWSSAFNGRYYIVLDSEGDFDGRYGDNFTDAVYSAFGYRRLPIEQAMTGVDVYEILDGDFHLFVVHNDRATRSSIVLTDFNWNGRETDVICTLPHEAYKENREAADEVVTDYAIKVLHKLAKEVLY